MQQDTSSDGREDERTLGGLQIWVEAWEAKAKAVLGCMLQRGDPVGAADQFAGWTLTSPCIMHDQIFWLDVFPQSKEERAEATGGQSSHHGGLQQQSPPMINVKHWTELWLILV